MRSLLLIIAGLLFAAVNAAEYVVDGDFEDVPKSSFHIKGAKAGGWTLKNQADFEQSEFTKDGKNTVVECYHTRVKPSQAYQCSASQRITGLDTSKSYKFSFQYYRYYNGVDCTLSGSFGSQTITSVPVPNDAPSRRDDSVTFQTVTASFTPAQSSGTLTVKISCDNGRGVYWQFELDNISLTDSV